MIENLLSINLELQCFYFFFWLLLFILWYILQLYYSCQWFHQGLVIHPKAHIMIFLWEYTYEPQSESEFSTRFSRTDVFTRLVTHMAAWIQSLSLQLKAKLTNPCILFVQILFLKIYIVVICISATLMLAEFPPCKTRWIIGVDGHRRIHQSASFRMLLCLPQLFGRHAVT